MKEIGICISTLNDGLYTAEHLLQEAFPDVSYSIVHQVTNDTDYTEFYKRYPYVTFIHLDTAGLSQSRNTGLQTSHVDYLYLCDDDLELTQDFIQAICDAGEAFPDADLLCFQLQQIDDSPYKKYSQKATYIGKGQIGSISSAEMVITRQALRANKIHFPENFGLGASYISGEEFLMLRNLMKSGGRIAYIPKVIAKHPGKGTGHHYTPELVMSKGAIIAATYGAGYIILNALYALRKYSYYKNQMGLLSFLSYIYSGSKAYMKHG